MVSYNPRIWFKFILTFHKEDTFRRLLPMLIAISFYSFLIACVELFLWNLTDNSYIKNLSLLHNLLGFVLSLLLVFRTNSAYDRWWEGNVQWNLLVQVTRDLAMKMNSMLAVDDTKNRRFFLQSIPFFAFVLRDHLRISGDFTPLTFNDPHDEFDAVAKSNHKPNKVTALIYGRVYSLQKEKKINGEEFLSIYTDVEKLNNICSACERIKNTPIPTSYRIFVKKFIYIYTYDFAIWINFQPWLLCSIRGGFHFYVLARLEIIAEEIEDPFGDDTNDIPTNKMAVNIKQQIEEVLCK